MTASQELARRPSQDVVHLSLGQSIHLVLAQADYNDAQAEEVIVDRLRHTGLV